MTIVMHVYTLHVWLFYHLPSGPGLIWAWAEERETASQNPSEGTQLVSDTIRINTTDNNMPWGAATKEKKEEKEPDISEEDVLRYNINEVQNDTLESTR